MGKTVTTQVTIQIPQTPNFILYDGGSIPVQDFDERTLREIGAQWTEELVKNAAKRRAPTMSDNRTPQALYTSEQPVQKSGETIQVARSKTLREYIAGTVGRDAYHRQDFREDSAPYRGLTMWMNDGKRLLTVLNAIEQDAELSSIVSRLSHDADSGFAHAEVASEDLRHVLSALRQLCPHLGSSPETQTNG